MNGKFVCLLFVLPFAVSVFAADDTPSYDFMEGGIAYNVISTSPNAVEVTNQGGMGYNYQGCTAIDIPAVVSYNQQDYVVTRIGKLAFNVANIDNTYISGLLSVSIPHTVTEIDSLAFNYCNGLTTISVDVDNPRYKSVDGIVFSKDETEIVVYPAGRQEPTYVIPEGVQSIVNWAFTTCNYLSKVVIPESVNSVGQEAFFHCFTLSNIYCFAETPPVLGKEVFDYSSVVNVYVQPTSVSSYGAVEGWSAHFSNSGVMQHTIGDAFVYLHEEQDNTETMTAQNGQYAYIQIDREFAADGAWYTLCLPFDLSEKQIAESFGDCALMQLEYADKRSEQLLYIHFASVSTIAANTPYLFKPAKSLTPPVFKGVAIKYQSDTELTLTTSDKLVSMTGIYAPTQVPSDTWYLGPDNTLYQPQGNVISNGFRAYFTLPSSLNNTQGLRARVVMDCETPTDINDIQVTTDETTQKVFENGQIFILRGGHKYNLQGQVVE